MATRHLRVVGLGDSTTAGTPGFLSPLEAPPNGRGNQESQYAYWMMKAHPDWIVLNRGINGQRSDEILARFDRDVLQEEPDYVVVLAGVNDIYDGRSLQSIQRNLLEIYQQALQANIIPVAATVLPYNAASKLDSSRIRELNIWIKNTARNLAIPFVDTFDAVADPNNSDRLRETPDGLHPGVTGYRSMAMRLIEVIEAHSASS